ncbi:hypothetical protein B2G88_18445 [Natronolimnobius baerhuensis]|uniref:Uncharacterized protein n=1 Tax=Natronolimnobius baerhuensis TaxID=253108 RepID=A0A202E461_9EURY|nr:hypothetical protein B2G88_18445 [Natronolimnobius baerhuensis]
MTDVVFVEKDAQIWFDIFRTLYYDYDVDHSLMLVFIPIKTVFFERLENLKQQPSVIHCSSLPQQRR